MDFLAKVKQTWTNDLVSQSRLWTLCDATQDVDYENTVKGTDLSTIDSNLSNAKIGIWCGSWFTVHNSYFTNILSYSNGITSWLDAKHLRVNEDFAEIYYEVYGTRLASKYVFADTKDANILATLQYNDSSGTCNGALSTNFSMTRLALVGDGDINTSIVVDTVVAENSLTATTATFTTNKTISAGTTSYIGETTASSLITSSGTTTIILNDNDDSGLIGYAAGQYVLVVDTTPAGLDYIEYVIINTYDAANKIITVPGLVHTYNLTNTRIYPCFNEITSITLDSGSTASAGSVSVFPIADRVPALLYS
jgi:hypothetical protein